MQLVLSIPLWLVVAVFTVVGQLQPSYGQTIANAAVKASSDQEKNCQAYIQLMRSDLRKEKADVMGILMRLDKDDSAKFWQIYKGFDGELTRFYDKGSILDRARSGCGLTLSASREPNRANS